MSRLPIPETAEDMETLLNDSGRVGEYLADPAEWKALMGAYTEKSQKRDPDINGELSDQQKKNISSFMEEQGYRPATQSDRLPQTEIKPKVDNDGFEKMADFFTAAWGETISRKGVDARLKALNESSGDQGGFLVPEQFRAELLRLALEASVVRGRATVIPMGGQTIRMPTVRDTSHSSTVYGGISGQWVAEAGSVSGTTNEPTFGQVALTAKKLTGYTRVSNELMADSAIALEAALRTMFSEGIAYFEDDAFIAGSGAGQPVGVLNAAALVSVAKETGQAATTVVWENIIKMFSRMHPASLGRAVWYCNPDILPQLATMSLTVGTGGAPVWLANGVNGAPPTLLGRPIIYTEKAETLGTAGDIVFSDFSKYLIGDRQALEITSSMHDRFTNDQTTWRFIHRVDGRPWIDSAITPRNGSNTLSPFVALATRA
jgi:HK97 family phage major capsid protein